MRTMMITVPILDIRGPFSVATNTLLVVRWAEYVGAPVSQISYNAIAPGPTTIIVVV